MSELNPFIIDSLRKMRAELNGMQKEELSFQSLNDLLPKYRDGLVGSGTYNPISQMQSGQQYITDVDQLDAVRRQTIKMVDAAIAALDSKQGIEPAAKETIQQASEKQPAATSSAQRRTSLLNFPRRLWDDFCKLDAIKQASIAITVVASLAGATWSYKSWFIPTLQYLNIVDGHPAEAPSIFLDCSYGVIPRVFPASGRYYVTEILPSLINQEVSLALGYRFGPPGAATLPPDIVQWAYECTLINYSTLPVFNVIVPIRVTFQEAHHPENQPSAWQSGMIKAIRTTSLTISKIDTGKDSPFVFYLSSQSPDFVKLDFFQTAMLQEGGDQKTKTGRLIVSANSYIQFSPNEAFQVKSP
jgi:hypothetical protein